MQLVVLLSYTLYFGLMFGSQYINPLGVEECSAPFTSANATMTVQESKFGINEGHNAQIIFQLLQSLCYMGWLAVAKIMLNPFGEDPDDFDTGFIVDRNLQTSLQIVNGNPEDFPSLTDPFNNMVPPDLEGNSLSLEVISKEKGPLEVFDLFRGGNKK